jgi:predicted HTH transcriptional regulator
MDIEEAQNLEESQNVELKEAQGGLPNSLWETYSSFCNTSGGRIYLGIREMKPKPNLILGVNDPEKILADFFALLRNKNKTSAVYVSEEDVKVVSLGDKSVIEINVPEAPRNAKPVYLNNNLALSYVRSKDGDHLMDEGERRSFLIDNSIESYDLQPNVFALAMEDVNTETLHRYRAEMNAKNPKNIYKELNDEDYLKGIGCLVKDVNGKSVLTNAAVLFFTSYTQIIRLFNYYLLDYRLAKDPAEKWKDRLVSDDLSWSGNMFDFYVNVYEKIIPYLPKPYRFENGADIGNRELQDALKEALANALSNYALPLSESLLVLNEGDRILFRNPGRIKVGLRQALQGGKSMPRNLGIITLFRLIGVADKAGTGIPKIFKAAEDFSLPQPLLTEQACPEETQLTLFLTPIVDGKLTKSINKTDIIAFLSQKGTNGVSVKEVMEAFQISRATASGILNSLEKDGIVQTNGKPTTGKKYFLK